MTVQDNIKKVKFIALCLILQLSRTNKYFETNTGFLITILLMKMNIRLCSTQAIQNLPNKTRKINKELVQILYVSRIKFSRKLPIKFYYKKLTFFDTLKVSDRRYPQQKVPGNC